MSSIFEMNAEIRQHVGKGASRRLRREAKVPAIVYGGKEAPVNLMLPHKDVAKALSNESVFAHILTLHVGKEKISVILRDAQSHPYKPVFMHLDFQRVSATDAITMNVPLHVVGGAKCPGVAAGGMITHLENSVEVRCLPMHLPEFVSIDISNAPLDTVLHLSDIQLPKGVTLAHDLEHDLAILSIQLSSRAGTDEVETGAPTTSALVPAMKAKAPPTTAAAPAAKPKKDKK